MDDREFFLDNSNTVEDYSKPLADSPYVRMYLAAHKMPTVNVNNNVTESSVYVVPQSMPTPIAQNKSRFKFAPIFVFLTSLLSIGMLFAGLLIEKLGIFVKDGKIISAYNIISDFVASLAEEFSLGGMLPFVTVALVLLGAAVAILTTIFRFKKSYCSPLTIFSCSVALIGASTFLMMAISATTFPIGVAVILALTLLSLSAAVLPKREKKIKTNVKQK